MLHKISSCFTGTLPVYPRVICDEEGFNTGLATFTSARCRPGKFILLCFTPAHLMWAWVHPIWPKHKAVFWSDDYICSHRNSLFIPARDNGKSDSDELGDEGGVMGLLFKNSTEDGTASEPPSARGAGNKCKDNGRRGCKADQYRH